jgi:hypothetical protein
MVDRNELIQCLTQEWDRFITRYKQLSSPEQREYLARQGYPSFKSLLAHLIAWWRVGIEVIHHHLSDPSYTHPQMDVDAFNNAIIARVDGTPDVEVLADFETARCQMLDLIASLSDADLANPKINLQLLIEVVEHLHEHE